MEPAHVFRIRYRQGIRSCKLSTEECAARVGDSYTRSLSNLRCHENDGSTHNFHGSNEVGVPLLFLRRQEVGRAHANPSAIHSFPADLIDGQVPRDHVSHSRSRSAH